MDNGFPGGLGFDATVGFLGDSAMIRTPALAALGGLVLLAACETAPAPSGPGSQITNFTADQREQMMRQQQIQGAVSGANPGMQNPVATGVGVGGIVRADQPGAGNVTAGAPVAVNPGVGGIVRQDGVGAPQPGQPRQPRRTN